MFPGEYVDYEIPRLSEAEMEAFYAAEPDEEWSGNVSGVNPRLDKKLGGKKKNICDDFFMLMFRIKQQKTKISFA